MIPAINWPQMMEPLCKKFLEYEHVNAVGLNEPSMLVKKNSKTGPYFDKSDTDLIHLENIDKAYQKGHEILMMIDSQMLYNVTSYDISDVFNNTHWIIYEGSLTTTDDSDSPAFDITKAVFMRFRVFTWDEDIDKSRFTNKYKPLSKESFNSCFYGYIECYNKPIKDYNNIEDNNIYSLVTT